MNDLYKEILVKRKRNYGMLVLKIVLIALTVFFLFVGTLTVTVVDLILGIAFALAAWYVSGRQTKEFEYLYVNGDFDIDVIYNMQKRKRAASFEHSTMVVFAPDNSHQLDPWRNKQGIKTYDYTSQQPDRKIWTGVYSGGNEEKMVRLEFDDDSLIQDLRRIEPRKVFMD